MSFKNSAGSSLGSEFRRRLVSGLLELAVSISDDLCYGYQSVIGMTEKSLFLFPKTKHMQITTWLLWNERGTAGFKKVLTWRRRMRWETLARKGQRMTGREILQIFGFSRFLKQTLSPSEMGLTWLHWLESGQPSRGQGNQNGKKKRNKKNGVAWVRTGDLQCVRLTW